MLFGIEVPIIQAPLAGSQGSELAAAVSSAGGLGSLPCGLLSPEQMREEIAAIRARTDKPFALNFFCHTPPPEVDTSAWRAKLARYYDELGATDAPGASRRPFDEAACAVVEETKPAVVSFHYGLPPLPLLERVRNTGATILSSATTVDEAKWLAHGGCDAIIAQGFEAGGHRGMFLADDVATQVGTLALVPQIVDAVRVPVIAAGGIGDARGIVAAFALGASAAQLGTAFLFCPEAKTSPLHREALARAKDNASALTNVFSGRPARGIVNRFVRELGPMAPDAPPFPLAGDASGPLRAAAEAKGSSEFSQLWTGQAARLARTMPAAELVATLWREANELRATLAT
ncbi:MAG TPA: nitronate monooxygenase family protein [Labilithrix sp.]|jgi:nitronate monooxygenase